MQYFSFIAINTFHFLISTEDIEKTSEGQLQHGLGSSFLHSSTLASECSQGTDVIHEPYLTLVWDLVSIGIVTKGL
jgi:hypothetical protein